LPNLSGINEERIVNTTTGRWWVALVIALVWTGLAKAGDEPDARQALAVCDQLRSTLAQTTTDLGETKQELAETRERLAKLEEAIAKITAEGKGSGSNDSKGKYKKVAVVNMTRVMNEYLKARVLKRQYCRKKEELDKEVADIQAEIEKFDSQPKEPQQVESAKQTVRDLKRKLAEKIEDRTEALQDLEDKNRKQIFKDAEAAAQVFARSCDIDLVLYYNRGMNEEKCGRVGECASRPESSKLSDDLIYYDARELSNKILCSGIPLFSGPGVDITTQLLNVLNWIPGSDK
jgi:Skp family chaperone for outer membrane proteins